MSHRTIKELIGKTFSNVSGSIDDSDELVFSNENEKVIFYHAQDCCECVVIDDIVGDLSDLEGSPITSAEERVSDVPKEEAHDSDTWTFYEFATAKGSVTVKWWGSSNGYYSEGVDMRVENGAGGIIKDWWETRGEYDE